MALVCCGTVFRSPTSGDAFHARLLDGVGPGNGRRLAVAAMSTLLGRRDAGGADVFATRALAGLALGNICGDGMDFRDWSRRAVFDGVAAFRQTGLGVCGRFGLFVGFAV